MGFPTEIERNYILFALVTAVVIKVCLCDAEFCYKESECESKSTNKRFLLYDVNPPEGFNLRRDVYMRFAILAHKLKKSRDQKLQNFRLVLPPWSHLYHWKYSATPEQIPWGMYFDLDSLKSFAPVIEMYEFFEEVDQTSHVVLDEVYVLQHFEDMFETGNFQDRMEIRECTTQNPDLNYFFYNNVTSHNVKCLSYHGPATKLSELLASSDAKTILLHHAEVALYDMYGSKLYWQCRRSMRFNRALQQIASQYRRQFLNSTDEEDDTVVPENWRDEKPERNAKGGPYLAVHLRRKDFLRGHAHQVPSLDDVVTQIINHLEKLKLANVFIATDASKEEYRQLLKKIPSEYSVFSYVPSSEEKAKYKDGGVAIIDQIICSHSRHFIGTFESTFSFRIQEEREIMGFPLESTFNCFCKNSNNCPQPTVWKIVH